jgi:DUF1365 family protein
MFCLLLDLDEVAVLSHALRLFSTRGFNLFGFRETDHGDGTTAPLRRQIEGHLDRAGISLDGGAIRVLCMPRVLGWVFNPISVFFCHGAAGDLRAMLYEVNNTFGQRHGYLIPVEPTSAAAPRQACAKTFHVSPFMDMAMTYHFRITPPGERAGIAIEVRDPTGAVLNAAFAGKRRALTDGNLLRAFVRHPLLALQVLGGIHWEALKLWRKGMSLRPLPPLPLEAVSIIRPGVLA